MKRFKVLVAVLSALFCCSLLFAQTLPQTINYQGLLKDGSGNLINGNHSLTFSLYDVSAGGSAVWAETKTINVDNGVLNTQLGSVSPITLPFTQQYWLGVIVDGSSELSPRLSLASVPYSFITMNVTDNSITSAKIQDGTITSSDIGSSQVVKSINGLKDNVNLVAGSNVSITPSGSNITISASSGSSGGTLDGSGTTNYVPLFTGTTTLGNSQLYQNSGLIGIGTTNPTARLDVRGNIVTGVDGSGGNLILATQNNTDEGGEITFRGAGSYDDWTQDSYINNMRFFTNSSDNNQFQLFNAGSGTANLFVEGSVGIGTDNPVAKLELSGSDALINGLTIGRGNGGKESNTAFGYQALSLTTGNNNTAIGYQALTSNVGAAANTAVGDQSLFMNISGSMNTAIGSGALYSNTTGNSNVSIGAATFANVSTGFANTAVGTFAVSSYGPGNISGGTFIGYNAGPYGANNDLTNITSLGYQSIPTASNQVMIGNSSVTSIGGYTGWTNFSDGRYKSYIQENVKGLEFIMKLRPITYHLDIKRLSSDLKEDQRIDDKGNVIVVSNEFDLKSREEKSQKIYTGFVAQEVEQAAKDLGYDFSGIDAPKNKNDFYGLRYAEFVVPLVKAVQEQQKMIEELKRRIEELERK